MPVQVKVESHLKELFRELDKKENICLDALGMMGEANAKKEITKLIYDMPETDYKRTGRLRNSLTYIVHEDKEEVDVGSFVSYAPYVEFGTERMKARPYLRNAIANHLAEYKALIEKIMSEE